MWFTAFIRFIVFPRIHWTATFIGSSAVAFIVRSKFKTKSYRVIMSWIDRQFDKTQFFSFRSLFYFYPPPTLPSTNATANPAIVASPILLSPPSSNASGIIDSASITKIAPEA
jgi:hypothetical protein